MKTTIHVGVNDVRIETVSAPVICDPHASIVRGTRAALCSFDGSLAPVRGTAFPRARIVVRYAALHERHAINPFLDFS